MGGDAALQGTHSHVVAMYRLSGWGPGDGGRDVSFQLLLHEIIANSVAQDKNTNVLPGSPVVQKWVSRG